MSNVEALCSEVVSRGLVAAAPALESLWRRFAGFGMRVPLAEQRMVLSTLPRLESPRARSALRGIVLSEGLPASLLPLAMRAAAEAALSSPAGFVGPLLAHEDATVRAAAFALGPRSGVPVELLREGLSDPSAPVRRLAAIALGIAGMRQPWPPLWPSYRAAELSCEPSAEMIEALTMIGDEDAVVHLGRRAGNHPALAGTVLDALRDMDSPRAQRLVHHLEAGGLRRLTGHEAVRRTGSDGRWRGRFAASVAGPVLPGRRKCWTAVIVSARVPRAQPSGRAMPCRPTCQARCATSMTLSSTGCCVRSSKRRAGGGARSAGSTPRRRRRPPWPPPLLG